MALSLNLIFFYFKFKAKSTVNICDTQAQLNSENSIYLQTPNYPNEYGNNLDCNCSMQTSSGSPIQIELLEFDIESSAAEAISLPLSASNHQIANTLLGPNEMRKSDLNLYKQNSCSKDYLSIGEDSQLCGTISPFSNLEHVQKIKQPKSQVKNLRFYSDDALTRRGFWIKMKASKLKETDCPENFMLVDNICLRVYNQLLNWYEAQKFCMGMGYSLAVIDNFELDKQLNNALFGENENEKKFWIGVKHLNQTNWFDHKNEVIEFNEDEAKWWPWLVVDSSTYNMGSCAGKRKNYLFLDDCYKRMSFACQYKPTASLSDSRVKLKCGKDAETFFLTSTTTTTAAVDINPKRDEPIKINSFVDYLSTNEPILNSCN